MLELTDLGKIPQRFYGRVYYKGNKTTYWEGYPIPPNSLISLYEKESVIWEIIQNPDEKLLTKLQNLEQYYFNEVTKIDTIERCILTQNQSERHPNLLDWVIDSSNLFSNGKALSEYQRPEIVRIKKILNCKNLVISFDKKGILHSNTQPAILSPDFCQFFWKGQNISQEDWEIKTRKKWDTILSEFGASLTKNQTEEVKVSDLKVETKPSSSINFKNEAKSASLRVLANKSSILLKNILLKLATRRVNSVAEKSKITQVIEKIFETPEGTALFQFLMGSSLPHLSKINHLSRFDKPFEVIGEEMRIGSMTDLGLIMVDKVEELIPKDFLKEVSKEFETTNIRAEISNKETSKKEVEKGNKTEELDEVSKLVKSMSSA